MFSLIRHTSNPIFSPQGDLPWEKEGVFNPGVTKIINEKDEEEIVMLYRAVGERESYISHIGLAKSKDGVSFERYQKNIEQPAEPVFGPAEQFDMWATEDPRITKIDDDFFVTYVAVPDRIMDHGKSIDRLLPLETATALLRTRNFVHFENLGIISPLHSDNKDIVLFPKKINGRYCMLHRPNRWDKEWFAGAYASKIKMELPCSVDDMPKLPSIWISFSDNLLSWDSHQILLSPSHAADAKIGPGLPPIETPDGWLMIYHHVEKVDQPCKFIYSVRAALLDLEDPRKVIAKLPYDILRPEANFETDFGTRIVFPTGGFVSADTLHVYYGASDRYVGLATGSLSELLAQLKFEGISEQ